MKKNQIDLFIFAGGRGSRINKITNKTQKCMIKINNEPFVNYQLKTLLKTGFIDKTFILASYRFNEIRNYYKNFKNINICVDKKRIGTYLSLLNHIQKSNKKFILVFNGDTFVNYNFKNFFSETKDVKILAKKIKNIKRYGSMEIKKNKLISFKEKINKKLGYINLGIALIRRKIIKNYSKKKFQKIEDEIFSNTKKFNIKVTKTKSYFIDIGTYKSLKTAKKYFK